MQRSKYKKFEIRTYKHDAESPITYEVWAKEVRPCAWFAEWRYQGAYSSSIAAKDRIQRLATYPQRETWARFDARGKMEDETL
jgi:hypothetical protein